MSKKVLITQSNYIPWKGYFDSIQLVDEWIVYDEMQYTKRDWRNRNQIKTPSGLIWLSVPVEVKGKFHQKISETQICQTDWASTHWKTLVANYSKAKYFKEYAGFFEKLYLHHPYTMLTELNLAFIRTICELLGIKTKIRQSSEFILAEERTERLVNICKEVGATEYYSGPAAKAYMDESVFERAGVQVKYLDYSNYPPYEQLYGEFVHTVSILDLIFNAGPETTRYMKYFGEKK